MSGSLASRMPRLERARRRGVGWAGQFGSGDVLSAESAMEPSQSDSSSGTLGSPGWDVGSPLKFAVLVCA